MRLSRIITALVAGLVVAGAPATAGAAQPYPPYPPGPPQLTLDEATILLGESVTLRGEGFGRREQVQIQITVDEFTGGTGGGQGAMAGAALTVTEIGARRQPQPRPPRSLRVRADENGAFQVTYEPPVPGEYTFTATGRQTGRTASATLTVLRPQPGEPVPTPGRPGLPVTGDSPGDELALGGGLLAGGVLLLALTLLWRRRSRRGEVV